MKKNKIALIAALVTILSIVLNVLPLFSSDLYYSEWWNLTISCLSPYALGYFQEHFMVDTSMGNQVSFNLFIFIFLLLLLLSIILYRYNNGKEIRLLTFTLCTLFLNQFASLINLVLGLVLNPDQAHFTTMNYLFIISFIVKSLAYMWFSYHWLKSILTDITPEIISTQYDTFELKEFVFPSRWVRIFHHLLDIFILILIYSIYIFYSFRQVLEISSEILGDKATILLYFIFVSFLYYTVSEILFGATPAKMLTQTRVVDEAGNIPRASTIWARTLCRRIPLDAISFILGNEGWHDSITKTHVVYLKSTGVKGNIYWRIIAAFLFLCAILIITLIINQ